VDAIEFTLDELEKGGKLNTTQFEKITGVRR
jgi:hypothetical protein